MTSLVLNPKIEKNGFVYLEALFLELSFNCISGIFCGHSSPSVLQARVTYRICLLTISNCLSI